MNAIGATWSPLHAAIESQRFTCVAVLLQRGADVSQTILGLLALAHAVDQSAQCGIAIVPTDIIRLLISAGADLGWGLKVARDYGRRDIIELLEAAAATG